MLTAELNDTAIVIVSDDANAENVALRDAVELSAPELLDAFEATDVGDDGLLRWSVQKEDWLSLLEVADNVGIAPEVNPEESAKVYALVESACQEAGLLQA